MSLVIWSPSKNIKHTLASSKVLWPVNVVNVVCESEGRLEDVSTTQIMSYFHLCLQPLITHPLQQHQLMSRWQETERNSTVRNIFCNFLSLPHTPTPTSCPESGKCMQVLVAQDVGGTASETYCRCKSSIKIAEQSPTQTLQAAWMLLVCLCGFMLNQ